VWTWLFDSEYSPLRNNRPEEIKGFTNAITKEVRVLVFLFPLSMFLTTEVTRLPPRPPIPEKIYYDQPLQG
jgi:hypothetical protein